MHHVRFVGGSWHGKAPWVYGPHIKPRITILPHGFSSAYQTRDREEYKFNESTRDYEFVRRFTSPAYQRGTRAVGDPPAS